MQVKALIDECLAPLFRSGLAYCHFFKAWQNEIGDRGCEAIIELLTLQGRARGRHMRELHLSDNRITSRGALALVRACGNIYPKRDRSQQPLPLWLRLHRNHIDVDIFEEQASPSSFCKCKAAGGGSGIGNCKPTYCR